MNSMNHQRHLASESSSQADQNLQAMNRLLAAAGAVIQASDLSGCQKRIESVEFSPVEVICSGLHQAAKQLADFKQADPLLGAAQWLVQATDKCTIADIQQALRIGYNRASRLFESASERKAIVLDDLHPASRSEQTQVALSSVSNEPEQPKIHPRLLNGHYVAVEAGALQLVRNVLNTDAASKPIRGEILAELDKATVSLVDGVVVDTALSAEEIAAAPSRAKELMVRLERAAHRMGELWNAHQGKGWPQEASEEFARLRDERLPLLRHAISNVFDQGANSNQAQTTTEILVKIISGLLGAADWSIQPETRIAADLGADSMDRVELVMEVEDHFDLEISEADAEKCVTLADLVALVDRLLREKAGA